MAETPETPGEMQGRGRQLSLELRGAELASESPVVDADPAEIERRFGRGRPPGAKNVATAKRLELFARIGGDPLLASARILAMPLAELAAMLDCDLVDAAKFQQAERFQAMPYVLSKRPQEIEIAARHAHAHVHLFAGSTSAPGAALGVLALLDAGRDQARLDGFDVAAAAQDPENETLDNSKA